MTTVDIPDWNANGVIPPVSSAGPTSAERSPYVASLSEFILRFDTSPKRHQILNGFMQYRGRLHTAGLTKGFQWLDGSFLENIEIKESRDPNDLDLVTFYFLPARANQRQIQLQAPGLFPTNTIERGNLKKNYFVDPYFVSLESQTPLLVEQTTYWYSMWSHRRDFTWKGFVQIDLDPREDAHAARAGGTS
jgi:hypothetical protein